MTKKQIKYYKMIWEGEMILNGTQQKRLFNILDGPGNEVNFEIKGKDLVGVINNYSKNK